MDTCIIVGAGDPYIPANLPKGFIIAADGGYDALAQAGIMPDLLIGDLDSVSRAPNGIPVVRYPVKKDETDMHLAYLEGVRRGYTEFMLLGGTGGREDHTFANYSLLLYGKNRGHDLALVGRVNTARVIKNEKITLHGVYHKHLSLFALGGRAEGVSITGAEYCAEDITLEPEFPLGASNRFLDGAVTVRVREGALLVITEN